MKVESLGFKTELIFHRFDGKLSDRGEYLVIETPSNPGFFWGNLLLFGKAPKEKDRKEWPELFQREFGSNPQIKHMTFAWDSVRGETGAYESFVEDGFKLERLSVLSAVKVHAPKKYDLEVSVRPLSGDLDWAAALTNQIACPTADFEPKRYAACKTAQMARYRLMAEQGLGRWFGAFLKGRLVADLGIFRDGEVGRFQQVATHPDFRRRGICGRLVYEASSIVFRKMGIKTLVIVADPKHHSRKIYQSVGFQPTEEQAGLCRWDPAFQR